MSSGADDTGLIRFASGVPGLDTILRGGFFRGAVYIIRGAPGAGKTILGNQICSAHAARGERALYVTLLAESHSRMLQHLRQLSFFDESRIPGTLYYVSAFSRLESDGLKGLMDLLRREIRAHEASLMVLDGLLAVEESSASDREFRKFIHELQGHAAAADCTVLLLTNGSRRDYHPENTMVDGLITLEDELYERRAERSIEVRKFRGTGFLRGRHSFRITDDGLVIYPRLESLLARPSSTDECQEGRVSTNVGHLDDMLGGGLPCGTVSLVLGPSGAGKTSLGLQFLAGCTERQPGLLFGFYETPQRALLKADRLGLDLRAQVEGGNVEIIWKPPTEQILDDLGNRLVEAVRRRKVRRLVVDGLPGFHAAAAHPGRVAHFFTALANELRTREVTTLFTSEIPDLIAPVVRAPETVVSTITENLILLRFVELRSQMHRLISVLKVRDSSHDPRLREFRITGRGIEIAGSFESAEHILSGLAVTPAKSRPRRPRAG